MSASTLAIALAPAAHGQDQTVLRWATHLGGTNSEAAQGVAAAPSGGITVGGYTFGNDYPLSEDAAQTAAPGRTDAVSSTLTDEGAHLGYSSYLGGSEQDAVHDVVSDYSGGVFLVGEAHSSDFPATTGAVQPASGGGQDVFAAKLSPDGSGIEWATYLGGSGYELAYAADVGPDGSLYVTGRTVSDDFPTTSDAMRRELLGRSDVFVAQISPDGRRLEYSTLFGGSNTDQRPSSGEAGHAIAVDDSGSIYIAGVTDSRDLPVGAGMPPAGRPLGVVNAGGYGDAFVARLIPGETGPSWAGYLGGAGRDSASAIDVTDAGTVYAGGATDSPDFPVFLARQPTHGGVGGFDAWLARIEPGGAGLGWSTFIGGAGTDGIADLVLNEDDSLWLTGRTTSTTFPVSAETIQPVNAGGGGDGFVVRLGTDGATLLFGTFLGGSGQDAFSGLARVSNEIAIVAGYTDSTDFPGTSGVFAPASSGGADAVVAAIGPPLPPRESPSPDPTCRARGRPDERPPHGPPGKPC